MREEITMTHAQKERIASLRADGASYSQIAVALGISDNTIKSYGRRNRLDDTAAEAQIIPVVTSPCAQCGESMIVTKRQDKRFCSDTCRSTWWKEHPKALNRKAVYHFCCSHCGAFFDSYGNNHRKYCSRGCYAKAKTTRLVEVRS